jgi:hypothetical protein
MEGFDGEAWKSHDWEILVRKRKGHEEVVNRLKELIEKRHAVKVSRDFRKQEREQLWRYIYTRPYRKAWR